MRRTLGVLLLGAGVTGLSYWGHGNNAETIQEMVKAEATALAADSRHGVTTSVSGRDVTLSGIAHDETEKMRLLDAAAELKGLRVVHDDLTLLPKQDIYSFGASKSEGAISDVKGFIPDEATRSALTASQASVDFGALELASGAPNDAWATAATAGLGGLAALQTGSLAIEGQNVLLQGAVDTDADYAALQSTSENGPADYNWDLTGVTVLRPNVDSYEMVAQKTEAGWDLMGYMPDQSAVDALSEGLSENDAQTYTLAANAPTGWTDRLTGAMAALDGLETGRIEMVGDTINITGEAQTEDDLKTYEMALASVANGASVESNVTVLTPSEPLEVTPEFDVTLDPISGLTVSGGVPAGLDASKIAEILGVLKYSGDTTEIEGEAGAVQSDKLSALRSVVAEFESLKISFDGEQMAVVGETLFDADPQRITEVIGELVEPGDSIQVSKSNKVYQDGFRRDNALTGGGEMFTSGYWIPEFDASTLTAAECAQRTEAAVNETKIRFRPGSADVDSVSRRILNALTGIIGSCLKREPDTQILIGGHTDSVGTEEDNLTLSNNRAANVLAALAARGLPTDQLSAQGFGELQPIADNETDEGRATNRRTTFEWIN